MTETDNNVQQKFAIFGMPRAGTTWLMSMLNEHPDITCYEELFNFEAPNEDYDWVQGDDVQIERLYDFTGGEKPDLVDVDSYLAYVHDAAPAPVMGYKIMYGQFRRYPSLLLQWIRHGYKIIFVQRDNLFAQYVSTCLKSKSGKAHATHNTGQTIRIDIEDMHAYLSKMERHKNLFNLFKTLAPLSKHSILYEALMADKDVAMARVFDFLGCAPVPTTGKTAKRVQTPYAELITNYNEVAHSLTEKKRQHYLEGI